MTPMQMKTVEWLANGEVGQSSKQMALWIGFGQTMQRWPYAPHPHDPADLNRCLLYLEHVPEARAGIPSMAQLSPTWEALVDRWEELENCFLDEAGLGWCKNRSAEKTYELMRSIIEPTES